MTRNDLIKEIKKYFQLKELVCPHCLNKYGDKAWQFLSTELLRTILTIRTKILNVPMIVNSSNKYTQRGLRCNRCNLVANKKNVYMSAHCFDDQTEILTNNGWRNIDTISNTDLVYSLNLETDRIEQTKIGEIVKYNYDGDLYCAENKHISYAVTDQHRMLVKTTSHPYKRVTNREISEKWQKYLDTIKNNNYTNFNIRLAKDIHGKRMFFRTAGISSENNKYNINILRLCMAVISDGYLSFKKNKLDSYGFNLKKERDKNELEDILKNLGIPYSKRYSYAHERNGTCGVYSYRIAFKQCPQVYEFIGRQKKIPSWFLSLSPDIMKQLIITYAKFDGTIDNRNNNSGISIFSIDEDNIDRLQIMSILSNMRCIKKHFTNYEVCIKGKKNIIDNFYHLYITQNKNTSKVNEKSYYTKHYCGRVWCVNNKNTTLIIRRNGKISIQGNCLGKAVDFHTNKFTPEQCRQKIKDNIDLFEYPIRLEEDVNWVHVDCYTLDSNKKLVTFSE